MLKVWRSWGARLSRRIVSSVLRSAHFNQSGSVWNCDKFKNIVDILSSRSSATKRKKNRSPYQRHQSSRSWKLKSFLGSPPLTGSPGYKITHRNKEGVNDPFGQADRIIKILESRHEDALFWLLPILTVLTVLTILTVLTVVTAVTTLIVVAVLTVLTLLTVLTVLASLNYWKLESLY